MNNSVRTDLYVLSIRNGQIEPSRTRMSKTCKWLNTQTGSHFSLLSMCRRTTMLMVWLQNCLTLSVAKKIVRPPTATGMGMSFQKEVFPKIFLDYGCEYGIIYLWFLTAFYYITVKEQTYDRKEIICTTLFSPLSSNMQIFPKPHKIFPCSNYYS